MLTRAFVFASITLALSSCVVITTVDSKVADEKASDAQQVYNLQQAIKNIAVLPRQTRLTLLNPEALNQSSVEAIGDYPALDTKQAVTRFHNHDVYTKSYTITHWINGFVFRQSSGQSFYDIDSYRLIGSKKDESNTETVLTKLYDVPKTSSADAKGKMGTGYMEMRLSKQGDKIVRANIALDWSLTKVENKTAQLCEVSTVYYDAVKFGFDTNKSDTIRDCYLINKQGDILGFESDMVISSKKDIPKLTFITK